MSDPEPLLEALEDAKRAFNRPGSAPEFEPGVNPAADAAEGEVAVQKACRLLELANEVETLGDYYGAILEFSFIVIEQTLQGYLLTMTGTDPAELRNHTSPYEFAKGQVPLEESTIETLQQLYEGRRTKHYYGTTVTTRAQAVRMRDLAEQVHDRIVSFDSDTERFCQCPDTT